MMIKRYMMCFDMGHRKLPHTAHKKVPSLKPSTDDDNLNWLMIEGNVTQSKSFNCLDFPNNFPYQILGEFWLWICLGWIWLLFSTALHRCSSISQTRQLISVLKRYTGKATLVKWRTTNYRQSSKCIVTNKAHLKVKWFWDDGRWLPLLWLVGCHTSRKATLHILKCNGSHSARENDRYQRWFF